MAGKIRLPLENKATIMGILNITPDSFSDGGIYYQDTSSAVNRAKQMLDEGADIIDIGGESTRPGSEFISEKEELERVIPVIKNIRQKLGNDFLISIDTYKAPVAGEALAAGADTINSLGGFQFDENLAEIVKKNDCQIIMYHIKGTPKVMQQGDIRYDDVIAEIISIFEQQIEFGVQKGIRKDAFILDPGIGFGKTVDQNLTIIKHLHEIVKLGYPVLIGVSRKSHLGKIMQEEFDLKDMPGTGERLEASLAETAVAVLNGAAIVRTHDVLETKKFLSIIDRLKNTP